MDDTDDTRDGERVELLTLGEGFEPDAVGIYTNPEGPFDYRAVPFVTAEDGYEEMSLAFKSSKSYISEVESKSDIEEGSIQFLREWVEE